MKSKRPVVLVVTRRMIRKDKYVDFLGEYHLELLIRLGTLPVMIPVVEGTLVSLPDYMKEMKGLLLVEGEDIDPADYKGGQANRKFAEETHPLKDKIEITLIRQALRHKLPILAICRGSQLVNVVCGGTLYGDVQKEKKSPIKHIDHDHYDSYRHAVTIVPGTPLERWYGQSTIQVNSYHHQGTRDLAPRFKPMAYAEDRLLEAYYDPKAKFLVGLQFHPERMLKDYAGNWRVWQAFGSAIHERAGLKPRIPRTFTPG
ncbi:MAG TPA: gamma-glutamyl-gamma-aminobutyrate hydrolase family protein [Candidatus Angelobacter sp.]|nr:gamma-glutamyl-gamma-aminobutyrate hydrolase family protein [Candidatus Angelobacter sp.]